jgi:hypothetical protein
VVYRLSEWKKAVIVDLHAIAAKLEELADRGGVGSTPHAVAIDRALAAVAAVNDTIDKMGSTSRRSIAPSRRPGGSILDPISRLYPRKAAMLETLAQVPVMRSNGSRRA